MILHTEQNSYLNEITLITNKIKG